MNFEEMGKFNTFDFHFQNYTPKKILNVINQ